MKKLIPLIVVLIVILPLPVSGVTPVHIGEVFIDTSLYEKMGNIPVVRKYVPGPFTMSDASSEPSRGHMLVVALLKKNSNQFDLYSFNGKIGTSVIPMIREPGYFFFVAFSCTMIDGDSDWETLVNYYRSDNIEDREYYFKVFDNDGTELLSNSGQAFYGSDGNSTFVIKYQQNFSSTEPWMDTWRFRTNISFSPTLSKTKASPPGIMQIYGQDNGSYL